MYLNLPRLRGFWITENIIIKIDIHDLIAIGFWLSPKTLTLPPALISTPIPAEYSRAKTTEPIAKLMSPFSRIL